MPEELILRLTITRAWFRRWLGPAILLILPAHLLSQNDPSHNVTLQTTVPPPIGAFAELIVHGGAESILLATNGANVGVGDMGVNNNTPLHPLVVAGKVVLGNNVNPPGIPAARETVSLVRHPTDSRVQSGVALDNRNTGLGDNARWVLYPSPDTSLTDTFWFATPNAILKGVAPSNYGSFGVSVYGVVRACRWINGTTCPQNPAPSTAFLIPLLQGRGRFFPTFNAPSLINICAYGPNQLAGVASKCGGLSGLSNYTLCCNLRSPLNP